MRYSSTTSVVLALFAVKEVLGGPLTHHSHRKIHQKRDLKNVNWNALDWDGMGIDWASAYAEGQSSTKPLSNIAPAPEPSQSPSIAAAEAPAIAEISKPTSTTPQTDVHLASDNKAELPSDPEPLPSNDEFDPAIDSESKHKSKHHGSKSSDNTNLSDDSKPDSSKYGPSTKLWKSLVGASNNRKVFGQSTPTYGKEVGYVSNVGIPEGSNMIKVESTSNYVFTNKFINISQKPMTVVIWNKAASPGLKDPMKADPNLGASIAPDHPALTIALDPQESQTVAFMDQSVIGWAQACEKRAMSGGFQTTWGEAQFNTTGSGYDVSAIQNPNGSNYIMHISSVEASSCDSTESTNMWVTDISTVGSGSCYIAQNTAHLITKMGGYAS